MDKTIHGSTGDYTDLITSVKDFVSEYDPHGLLTAFILTMFAIAVLAYVIRSLPSAWSKLKGLWLRKAGERQMRRDTAALIEDEISDAIEARIESLIDEGKITPVQGNVERTRVGMKLGYRQLLPVKSVKEGIRSRLRLFNWRPAPLPDAKVVLEPPSVALVATKFGSKA